jgi:UDPglucose 6-dehydrogenase
MKKLNIAIVGAGFVGAAVAHGFQDQNITLIDPKLGTSTVDLLGKQFDAVFICVPTPMGSGGVINVSIVEQVLRELQDMETLLVLKSTVLPNIVDRLSKEYTNFVYNPEFLTEARANYDFENPFLHVFGGNPEYCDRLETIYKEYSICKPCKVMKTTAMEASFIKYSINSYLMAKVVFWNQMKELIDLTGADYSVVQAGFTSDPRIGTSHSNVPDKVTGEPYCTSNCFNKDVPAIVNMSDNKLSILREVWNINCRGRMEYGLTEREIAQHITYTEI